MNLYEIVMKLNGPVQPIGDSGKDLIRLENLKSLTELVDKLLREILIAESFADRHEASMRAVGQHARNFLRDTCGGV